MEAGDSSKGLRDWITARAVQIRDAMEEALVAVGTLGGNRSRFVKLRDRPKGTKLIRATNDTVKVKFKAAVRFWWKLSWLLWPLYIAATVFGFGIAAGSNFYRRIAEARTNFLFDEGIIDVLGIVLQSLLLGLQNAIAWAIVVSPIAWLIMVLTRPWVRVYADREKVVVGRQSFDRRHFGGLRIGYEIKTGDALLKNDFHDLDIGLQGLRLVYGPWGEDLPYLVNKYHANEIVLWLNLMIDQTIVQTQTTGQSGQREQRFE